MFRLKNDMSILYSNSILSATINTDRSAGLARSGGKMIPHHLLAQKPGSLRDDSP